MTNVLAFSGGPDSMYLLHTLLKKGQKPVLAHLNHGLRGKESDEDENFCKKVAKKNGLTIETEKIAPPKNEEEARNARYDFLEKVRKKHKARKILTAHHLNDNIETVLFNLTRGTGLAGLTGIPSNRIQRPLLSTTKEEILAYLKKNRIKYREDSSNRNTKFSRNRIRNKVIPELRKINPNLEKSFLGSLKNFQQIQDFLDQEAKKFTNKITEFKRLHPAVQTHIILKLAGPSTSQKEVEEIRRIILAGKTDTTCKIGRIEYGKLVQSKEHSFQTTFKILKKHPAKFAPNCAYLNFDKIRDIKTLKIRTPLPGDRIKPLGLKGSQKLQDLFTNKKIPQSLRKTIPVITLEGEIAAVGWLTIAEKFKILPSTRQILKIIFKDTK